MAWSTPNATTMNSMFKGASSFNQPIAGTGGLDTSLVQSMDNMLDGATAFDQDLGGFDVTSLTSAQLMLNGVLLGETNYDNLLTGWSAQAVQNNVVFDGGLSLYSSTGEVGRDDLTDNHFWTITDGGISGPTTYPVSSASFAGTGATYYKTQTPVMEGAECVCITSYVYLPDLAGSHTIVQEARNSGGNARFTFKVSSSILQYEADGTDDGTIRAGFAASLQVGWNEVGVTHSLAKNGVGTDTVKLYANGASQTTAFGSATRLNNTNYGIPLSIGTSLYTAGGAHFNHFHGEVSFVRISRTRVFNDTEMEALMTTPANCLDLIDSSITDDLDFAVDACVYGGILNPANALIDHIGSNNLTAVGSFNYVDRGLEVNCP